MQPSDSSLYDFGFLSVLLDLSPLSVDFESLVMNFSSDLFRGWNIEAYIFVSCETVVRSGNDLNCGTVGNLVSGVASASGGTGFVQPGLDGLPWAAPCAWIRNSFSNFAGPPHSCVLHLHHLPGVSAPLGRKAPPDCSRLRILQASASSGQIWHLTFFPG